MEIIYVYSLRCSLGNNCYYHWNQNVSLELNIMEEPCRAGQRVAARGARGGRTGRGTGAGRGASVGQQNEAGNFQNFVQAMTIAIQGGNRTQLQVVEQFRRLHPPSFEGTTNPLDAEEWLRELEKVFTFINCTDDQKVACAVFMLKGEAGYWWEMTNRAHNVPNNPITWFRFKELFNQKYFPEELWSEKEFEFLRLTQGSMSLLEYERKFEQLSRFAPYLIDIEQRKINRSVGGLKSDIRKHVRVLGLVTYADVLQKAQILAREDEIVINAKSKEKVHGPPQKKQWNKNFQGKNDYRNRCQKRQRDDDTEKKELPLCETCGKKHGGICFRKVGACFKCGKPGHFIQNCPVLKKDPGAQRKD